MRFVQHMRQLILRSRCAAGQAGVLRQARQGCPGPVPSRADRGALAPDALCPAAHVPDALPRAHRHPVRRRQGEHPRGGQLLHVDSHFSTPTDLAIRMAEYAKALV